MAKDTGAEHLHSTDPALRTYMDWYQYNRMIKALESIRSAVNFLAFVVLLGLIGAVLSAMASSS